MFKQLGPLPGSRDAPPGFAGKFPAASAKHSGGHGKGVARDDGRATPPQAGSGVRRVAVASSALHGTGDQEGPAGPSKSRRQIAAQEAAALKGYAACRASRMQRRRATLRHNTGRCEERRKLGGIYWT